MCAVLDPRFKSLKCVEKEEGEPVWKEVIAKAKDLVGTAEENNDTRLEESALPSLKKRRILGVNLDNSSSEEDLAEQIYPVVEEVEAYRREPKLPTNKDPLLFWKKNQYIVLNISSQ